MNRRPWKHLIAAALAATAFAIAAPVAVATAPDAATEAAGAATHYLEARAAAVAAADPGAVLSPCLAPGVTLLDGETLVAGGAALRARQLGHSIEAASCQVTEVRTAVAPDGQTATVAAHAITTLTWRAATGALDTEASGVDHTMTVKLVGDAWKVAADTYADVMRPGYLEAAGAPARRVRRAERALERVEPPVRPPAAGADRPSRAARRYNDIIVYDRPGAQAYADKYALSYNPTYVHFGADCADFASQCARAGVMPVSLADWDNGWWYDKKGSSSPGDDTYSLSWINVTKQMSFWNARRTDWATSAGTLSRGDFIYYDWTGDGVWDHVAVVTGTNSAGQKIVDAHTTDLYHVFWKLGSSTTHYKYAKVRTQWVV